METARIIAMRDTLKAGKNLPLRVYLDNLHIGIDESSKTQFTKWDDTNGILYSFRLLNMQLDGVPNNKYPAITVFAISYEDIQGLEVVRLGIDDIDALVSNIVATGATFSDEFKNLIKSTYTKILDPNLYKLSPTDMNRIISSSELQSDVPDAVNAKDDWYEGKFTENFMETVATNRYNESIKETIDESTDADTSTDSTESTDTETGTTEESTDASTESEETTTT